MSSSRKSRKGKSMSKLAYTNAVYFPNERIYQGDTPGGLNYSVTNHVYYAFANVSPDGGVFVSLGCPPPQTIETALTDDGTAE